MDTTIAKQRPHRRSNPRKKIESGIQKNCVKWFWYQYRSKGYLIYAIPNGGLRSKAEAAIMSGEGVLAAMPDLHIPVSNGKFLTLYIEMKKPGQTWGPEQKLRRDELRALGHCVELAHSLEEFIKIVKDYFHD